MKVQIVTPYRISHLQHYGVTVRGNVTNVYPPEVEGPDWSAHVNDSLLVQALSDKRLGHISSRQAVAVKQADSADCDSDNLC
jgi:hypothetical protein